MWWRKENYNRYPWMMMYRFFHRNHQRNSKNILEQCKLKFFVNTRFYSLAFHLYARYAASIIRNVILLRATVICWIQRHLKLWQTSVMELRCKLNEQLLAISYFCKKSSFADVWQCFEHASGRSKLLIKSYLSQL